MEIPFRIKNEEKKIPAPAFHGVASHRDGEGTAHHLGLLHGWADLPSSQKDLVSTDFCQAASVVPSKSLDYHHHHGASTALFVVEHKYHPKWLFGRSRMHVVVNRHTQCGKTACAVTRQQLAK
jgi:hypothetical protein